MINKGLGSGLNPTTGPIPRWLRYLVLGGAAGFVVGVAALFVVAVLYGKAMGLSPAACTAAAVCLTLLLSQPAGLAGMVAGTTVGAAAGAVVYYVRHFSRAM